MSVPTWRPLFVTSFAEDMYRTGAHLMSSYLTHVSGAPLLVCHEGRLEHQLVPIPARLITYDLDGSDFLRTWLTQNRDIIPRSLGGEAPVCSCPAPENAFSLHRPGCPAQWFNKNASRWFRKIVSLDHALTLRDFDAIVWIDADCQFIATVDGDDVRSWFDDASVFFVRGEGRDVIESGVIGFRLDDRGRRTLNAVIDRYRSGTFRTDVRWDDGYQFQRVIENAPHGTARDHGGAVVGYGHVLATGPLGRFISHAKGIHQDEGLMT